MTSQDELTHEYLFKDTAHFIETPFVKNDSDAISTLINTPSLKGNFIEYSNGVKILVISGVTEGKVYYYTNYPLKEIAPDRFAFDIS